MSDYTTEDFERDVYQATRSFCDGRTSKRDRIIAAYRALQVDNDAYREQWEPLQEQVRELRKENERLRGQRDTLGSAVDEFLRFPMMDALPKLSAAFAQVRKAAADEAVGDV